MNYLAVDLGDKRTGLAVGDDIVRIIQPITVLETPIGEQLIHDIQSVIHEHGIDCIVMGLPLNMDGSDSQRSKLTKSFAEKLQAFVNLPIEFQDERLTSAAAEEQLNQSGKTHKQKKKLRDALAAAEILKDFLHAN
ncbi:MAG: Holliday junction resolvase RuvX [Phycisphaerae bacterium]|nr:Holliday junction resolvase RuvX [Phycisphaerae bacterium]|tara:strand:- start:3 stop:410 length:408 start_codon:yes stop_codon:yes gene_type:complete